MTDHSHRTIERHTDVAIIGGSAAGLAAALQLGRQRRGVIVVDAGEPRNAPAAHSHGYLGHEGVVPADLTAIGREEVRSYGGEVLDGRAVSVGRDPEGRFRIDLVGGNVVVARRVLAATGLVDELPDIPGLAERWGHDVIHCPFCHGYEVRDRRLVQVVTHPFALHPTPLLRHLSAQLTVVLDPDVDRAELDLDGLRAGGVLVVVDRVAAIHDDEDGGIRSVELSSGEQVDADAVVIGPRFVARVAPFAPLGLTAVAHPSGLGDHLETDPLGATTVAGVYAAGNVTDPSLQVLHAAAQGSKVGAMISFDLAREDLEAAARPSANQTDWDHRYGGERMWSGNPNGTLVREVADLAPGRALDVGAGEGGDAIWLAEQGWDVVASDVSERALVGVADAAAERGASVTCVHVDANAAEAFAPGGFDLVSAQYASIPRTADGRGVANLLAAVAPGGTLLVVSHDLAPMRQPVDTAVTSRAFDPDAYVRVDDVIDVIAGDPEWEVVVHEVRERPAGAASSHHVDDVVLRVRRRPR